MAIAALASLVFDLIITAGVYSLVGFEVSPATVIGLLTILGFSLYDTVIVFDKVEENTHGFQHTTRRTFAEQANLAINQTFMRSINTSLISVLPIISLMVVAVWLLGVGTLKDLALVQLVGVICRHLLVDLLRHAAAGAHCGNEPSWCAPTPAGCSGGASPGASPPRRRRPTDDDEPDAEREAVAAASAAATAKRAVPRQAGAGCASDPTNQQQDRTARG